MLSILYTNLRIGKTLEICWYNVLKKSIKSDILYSFPCFGNNLLRNNETTSISTSFSPKSFLNPLTIRASDISFELLLFLPSASFIVLFVSRLSGLRLMRVIGSVPPPQTYNTQFLSSRP